MIKKFLFVTLLLFSLIPCRLEASSNESIVVEVIPQPVSDNPIKGTDEEGKRMPPRRIVCTISESDGVVIGIDKEEITAFEVWTVEGDICVASFGDESSFVSYLFAISTECIIRFVTEEYLYTGYL